MGLCGLGMLTSVKCAVVTVFALMSLCVLALCYVQVDGKYSDEAALILHRKGFDCRFSSRGTGLLCSTTQGKVSRKCVCVSSQCPLNPS